MVEAGGSGYGLVGGGGDPPVSVKSERGVRAWFGASTWGREKTGRMREVSRVMVR